MTIYNTKYTPLIWRGITLRDFASSDIAVSQSGSSIQTCIGIFGESFSFPHIKRGWEIRSSFLASSDIFKILDNDNLCNRSGLIVINDMNLDVTDVYSGCRIVSVNILPGGNERQVVWYAKAKNGR